MLKAILRFGEKAMPRRESAHCTVEIRPPVIGVQEVQLNLSIFRESLLTTQFQEKLGSIEPVNFQGVTC